MPARRRVRHLKNAQKGRKLGLVFKVIMPLAVIAILVLLFKVDSKYWNGRDKVAFAFKDPNGNIGVTVLDPELTEETTLVIPGDTEVNVARGYGVLRIKNVWQLGVNEKLNGMLLAQTVTQNFHFPTTLWSEKGLTNLREFVFSPGKTNISFADRLSIATFSLKVKSIDESVIDLGKNQFLKKQNLADGLPGYTVNGPVSGRLTVYFSDNNFGDKNLKFGILDATNRPGVAEGVGAVLEVLGGKVVSIDRQDKADSLDCEVRGQNTDAVKKISILFSCNKTSGQSNFDLEIRIGSGFAKRH